MRHAYNHKSSVFAASCRRTFLNQRPTRSPVSLGFASHRRLGRHLLGDPVDDGFVICITVTITISIMITIIMTITISITIIMTITTITIITITFPITGDPVDDGERGLVGDLRLRFFERREAFASVTVSCCLYEEFTGPDQNTLTYTQ